MQTIDALRRDYAALDGQDVTVAGWARTVRESKNLGFIELNDGSCFDAMQVVFERDKLSGGADAKLTTGCAIEASGTLVATPDAKQPFELQAKTLEVVGECPSDYPLQKKRHSLEYLRTQLHIRPRTNTFHAVFRVRSLAAHAVHDFFAQRNFVLVHTPIITGSDCEGAGEMFRVTTLPPVDAPRDETGGVDYSQDFFERETNLTVSGQLYGEAYALALRNIYTFGPTFRAEKSATGRHAAEFWMIEPEMAFAGMPENMATAEALIKHVIAYVMDKAPSEMAFFNRFVDEGLIERLEGVAAAQFAHMSYTEAVAALEKSGQSFEFPVKWGIDLQTEHERYLTEKVHGRPVFVTDYPKDIKAFYMRDNGDGTVAAMDCLVPGVGEIVGGSVREERLGLLTARMDELGLCEDDYWWYLQLRQFGGAPHCGFGLGFERLVMYLTGVSNIRDVCAFPRTYRSADF